MLFFISIIVLVASCLSLRFLSHITATTTVGLILLVVASISCFIIAVLCILGCTFIANRCNDPQERYDEIMVLKTYVEQNELTIYNFNQYKTAIEKIEKYKFDYRKNKHLRNSIWMKVYANKHWDTAKYIDYEINPEYLKCIKNK